MRLLESLESSFLMYSIVNNRMFIPCRMQSSLIFSKECGLRRTVDDFSMTKRSPIWYHMCVCARDTVLKCRLFCLHVALRPPIISPPSDWTLKCNSYERADKQSVERVRGEAEYDSGEP